MYKWNDDWPSMLISNKEIPQFIERLWMHSVGRALGRAFQQGALCSSVQSSCSKSVTLTEPLELQHSCLVLAGDIKHLVLPFQYTINVYQKGEGNYRMVWIGKDVGDHPPSSKLGGSKPNTAWLKSVMGDLWHYTKINTLFLSNSPEFDFFPLQNFSMIHQNKPCFLRLFVNKCHSFPAMKKVMGHSVLTCSASSLRWK